MTPCGFRCGRFPANGFPIHYRPSCSAGYSELKEDEVDMVSRTWEDRCGKRGLSLLAVLATALLFALAGCGVKGEGADVGWLSYRLTVAELREMEYTEDFQDVVFSSDGGALLIGRLSEEEVFSDSLSTQLAAPPSGSRYVVVRLLSAEGGISEEDITDESVGTVHLRASSGDDFEPLLYIIWGIEYDSTSGFSTNEEQEGFCLLFAVSEDIALRELGVEVSDS